MYYLQSRYYNPEWERFINADALVGQLGKLLSHNVFAYCSNNPIKYFDPSGYVEEENAYAGGFGAESLGGGEGGSEGGEPEGEIKGPNSEGEVRGTSNYEEEYASSSAQYERLKRSLAQEEIKSVKNSTVHGAERIIERGFNETEINEIKLSPNTMTQSDGAKVYIGETEMGRFNVYVEGENGCVTALKNISEKSLVRLAKNFGWE